MATPPKTPKPPKAGTPAPAPRRSTRKASTAKPATARAPAKPKDTAKAPAETKAAVTTPVEKAASPARKPTAARKPAVRKAAPKAQSSIVGGATASVKTLAAKPVTTVERAVAALPPVDRKAAWSIGAVALAAGAGLLAFFTRGRIGALLGDKAEGHVPTDLLDPKRNADDRAIADFRPDMDAPMTAAEREALRPATGPAPSLSADRGSTIP